MSKHVVIIPGDDAAPEAMAPTVEILRSLALDLTFTEFPSGEEGVKRYGSRAAFDQALREAIDHSETTLFGSTNGTTGGIGYCAGESSLMPTCVRRVGGRVFAAR